MAQVSDESIQFSDGYISKLLQYLREGKLQVLLIFLGRGRDIFFLAGLWRQAQMSNSVDGETVVVENLLSIDDESEGTGAKHKIFRACHLENYVATSRGLVFRRCVSQQPGMKI